MKTGMFNSKHHCETGPGGWLCTCCGPAPKHRNKIAHRHKRKMYRELEQLEESYEQSNVETPVPNR